MSAGCQAKVPLSVPVLGRTWAICYAPPVRADVYRCHHGHERRGVTCAEHAPEPGAVGCAACFDHGHECPMAVVRSVNL